jgi:hypothetical protein
MNPKLGAFVVSAGMVLAVLPAGAQGRSGYATDAEVISDARPEPLQEGTQFAQAPAPTPAPSPQPKPEPAEQDFYQNPKAMRRMAEEYNERGLTAQADDLLKKADDLEKDRRTGLVDTNKQARIDLENMVRDAVDLEQQVNELRGLLFNDDGTPKSSIGDLSPFLAKLGKIGQQLGVGPNIIAALDVDPNDAAAVNKMKDILAAQIGQGALGNVHQQQFYTFMDQTPGMQMPAKAALFIIDNVLKAHTQAIQNFY